MNDSGKDSEELESDVQAPEGARARIWRRTLLVLRLAAGIALILVGIAGVVLPILPGWVLIALGLVIVAPKARISRLLRVVVRRLKRGRIR